MLYFAPAWWEFVSQQENGRIQSVMSRLICLQYLASDNPTLEQRSRHVGDCLFSAVLSNPGQVLHRSLPPKQPVTYRLPFGHDPMIVCYP